MSDLRPLADDVVKLVAGFPGAREREQIGTLLTSATRYMVEDDLAQAVSATITHAPNSVERNLDFIALPSPVCWFEYSEAARQIGTEVPLQDAKRPAKVGCLLVEHPDDTGTTVGVVAWRYPDGATHHAFATIAWNSENLTTLAHGARHLFSKESGESWSRMLYNVHSFIPQGFGDELAILHHGRDISPEEAADLARRDATSEALFLFGILLMLSTKDIAAEDLAEQETSKGSVKRLKLAARKPRWWRFDRGFQRNNERHGTTLSWVAPKP
jgi:hypothetical protein